MLPHPSVSAFADQYDGYIIDLWGVIHDGHALYPGVTDCLSELRARRKKIIFLSNAPRRARMAIEGLRRLQVPKDAYDYVFTSGEAAYDWLVTYPYPQGSPCLILGPERDAGLLNGLQYPKVLTADRARFLVVTGYDNDDSPEDEHQEALLKARARNLPLVCANPDHIVVRHSGKKVPCAGIVAEQYRAMGGEVIFFGKPYPAVYARCLDLLAGLGVTDKRRILAIGDNLDTDIAGGLAAGLDSILVTGGILRDTLGGAPGLERVREWCGKAGVMPTGVMAAFGW